MPKKCNNHENDTFFDTAANLFNAFRHLHLIETGYLLENLYAVKTGTVNFFIYRHGTRLIGFDSGFGKRTILRELAHLGIHPHEITHLFLTHSDFDHAGGVNLFPRAELYLSVAEEPLVTQQKTRLAGLYFNPKILLPYRLLKDDEVVHIGSTEVRAISTPGHTDGSMSYLLNDSVLFVGDTFKLVDGQVFPIRNYLNMDTRQQKSSIKKLASLDNILLALTAHSGFTKDFAVAIHQWK